MSKAEQFIEKILHKTINKELSWMDHPKFTDTFITTVEAAGRSCQVYISNERMHIALDEHGLVKIDVSTKSCCKLVAAIKNKMKPPLHVEIWIDHFLKLK